jgi:hypothetical protein
MSRRSSHTSCGACHGSRRLCTGHRLCELPLLDTRATQPPHPGLSWFHVFMGDYMSGSVAERRRYLSRSSSLPGISDATISIHPLYRIARLAAVARTSAAPEVFAFCLLSTAFYSRGRTLPLRGRFHLQAASGRLRRSVPIRGVWSIKRSGSSSRGYSHHCRLHHLHRFPH